MITEAEDQGGATALKAYIDKMLEANGLAWEELFIPDSVYTTGAQDAITAADESEDQSPAARQAAAALALRAAINSTGQGDRVSDANIAEAASAILTTVAKVRAQENPPKRTVPEGITGLTPPTAPGATQTGPQPPEDTSDEDEDEGQPHEDDEEEDTAESEDE